MHVSNYSRRAAIVRWCKSLPDAWSIWDQYPRVAERRKEMFYLMMHSTHFIYGYMTSNMVKEHSDSVREETCCHHYCTTPLD